MYVKYVKERWKQMLLTVLRRSFVRTRTSTTPVGVGLVRVGGVGAPEDGFIRYYAGEGNRGVSVTGSVRVRRSKVDGFREGSTKCQRAMMRLLLAVLRRPGCADEDVHNPSVDGLGTSWGGWCSRRQIHPLLRGRR